MFHGHDTDERQAIIFCFIMSSKPSRRGGFHFADRSFNDFKIYFRHVRLLNIDTREEGFS
ncbi:hypothetical protein CN311_25375 [Mesorhizobium sanjuanii]|uniref:Uncharacterized protein n=1 Tax=Mesorhizobium sanjuanii TaxID=2037900 RepID=A0A2A6F9L3_9HYPH|nr:hypothetical protein CN311_25375 [Mesorhizobium sanjuanii]